MCKKIKKAITPVSCHPNLNNIHCQLNFEQSVNYRHVAFCSIVNRKWCGWVFFFPRLSAAWFATITFSLTELSFSHRRPQHHRQVFREGNYPAQSVGRWQKTVAPSENRGDHVPQPQHSPIWIWAQGHGGPESCQRKVASHDTIHLQSWRAAVSADFLDVLSTSDWFQSLIG